MREQALRYLYRDPLLHTDMTEALRRDLGEVAAAEENGVLLSVDEGYCGMLSCSDGETALRLLRGRDFPLLAIHQAEQEELLCRRLDLTAWMRCYQAVYVHPVPPEPAAEDIRRLSGEYLEFVKENYRREDSEYLLWLLERDALYGAFRDGRPVGMIGNHAEGSMGLLEVLPAYRRQGIGSALERFLIARELSLEHVPYCQLFTENAASLSLQKSLGMKIADGTVIWLKKTGI